MKTTTKDQPKKKGGRPKGSKNALPFVTFTDAINYAKKIWSKAQYSEMSFDGIAKFMGEHPQKAVRVLKYLKDFYGVVEKLDNGRYRLTESGKGVVKDDQTALREAFSKDRMFSDLLTEFWGKSVTEDAVTDYIRKNYKYVDSEDVKTRLLEGMGIIRGSVPVQPETIVENKLQDLTPLPLFQLYYALKRPSEREIESLTDKVIKVLHNSNDDTLELIADLMSEKKTDTKELVNFLERAMKKLNLYVSKEEAKTKHRKEEKSDESQGEKIESSVG